MMLFLEKSSTDQYIPQLPLMQETFNVSNAAMAATLQVNWITKAIANMIIGPMSDRYGRKPLLLISSLLLCIGSLACAVTGNIWCFYIFRILQGLGESGD